MANADARENSTLIGRNCPCNAALFFTAQTMSATCRSSSSDGGEMPCGGCQKANSRLEGTIARTAATEAFEEAGVYGAVAATPLGSYRPLKCGHGIRTLPSFVEVVLFPMEVESQLAHWPEKGIRERCWFTRNEVRYRIAARPIWQLISLLTPATPLLAMSE